jgi:hypothetical protein
MHERVVSTGEQTSSAIQTRHSAQSSVDTCIQKRKRTRERASTDRSDRTQTPTLTRSARLSPDTARAHTSQHARTFLTAFLFLLSFLRSSTLKHGMPFCCATSQCLASPRMQIAMRGLGTYGSLWRTSKILAVSQWRGNVSSKRCEHNHNRVAQHGTMNCTSARRVKREQCWWCVRVPCLHVCVLRLSVCVRVVKGMN